MYKPGELIFKQGSPSPDFYIIIHGSVCASITKPEWGPKRVKMLTQTYFDGQVFGEMSDYEAQKDQISQRMLKELQQQKYSAHA